MVGRPERGGTLLSQKTVALGSWALPMGEKEGLASAANPKAQMATVSTLKVI